MESPISTYRGTSLMRNTPPVGSYGSPMPRDLCDTRGLGVSDERGTPVGEKGRTEVGPREDRLFWQDFYLT